MCSVACGCSFHQAMHMRSDRWLDRLDHHSCMVSAQPIPEHWNSLAAARVRPRTALPLRKRISQEEDRQGKAGQGSKAGHERSTFILREPAPEWCITKKEHTKHTTKSTRETKGERGNKTERCVRTAAGTDGTKEENPLLARMAQKRRTTESKKAQTYRGRCHRGDTTTATTSTLQNVGQTTKSTRETKGKRGNKTERCVRTASGTDGTKEENNRKKNSANVPRPLPPGRHRHRRH